MGDFHLLVFDQTRAPQGCLGERWSWRGDVPQLISAAHQFIAGPNPGSVRLFALTGHKGLALPIHHDLCWNGTLESERELKIADATEWLSTGAGLQIFIYNGDSDCIRHFLALPVADPQPWFSR
ncbi:hypothetical protein ABS71_02690 [bacterium SCN 62-11]|nr:MAG: hypothetical protein ABS71_02690 [bacterium SCN 62-11]